MDFDLSSLDLLSSRSRSLLRSLSSSLKIQKNNKRHIGYDRDVSNFSKTKSNIIIRSSMYSGHYKK